MWYDYYVVGGQAPGPDPKGHEMKLSAEVRADAKIKDLQRQNAELRKLVRDAWGNGHPDKSCGDCEIIDECNAEIEEARKEGNGRWNTRCLFERRIEDRMRDLGIEVD